MDEFKDKGNKAYQDGDFQLAIQHYTEGIERHPTIAVLYSNRSAAYVNVDDFSKAQRDAEMCIELEPEWAKGWWRKGTAQIKNMKYKDARQTFSDGLKKCPSDSHLLEGLEKANKYLKVTSSIQGGGEMEGDFDLDGPSERNDQAESAVEETDRNKTKRDGPVEEAWPGTAEVEIDRIKKAPNHYAVLHVSTDASTGEMKKNYHTLAKLLHPDRCQLDGAGDAMMSVSQAYDTLANVLKKTLYDQFLSQSGGDADTPNQTYQEWESRQQPVELPKWLSFLLGIGGFGYVFLVILGILFLPFVLVIIILFLIVQLLWLPFRLILLVFFPERYRRMKEREQREIAKMEEQQQDRMFAHV